ncbi:MAG: hypothetical protein JSS66_00640 [Armatimonadetes bacterium]|nr:hypothetical protein [Armatimonadota bacterium]
MPPISGLEQEMGSQTVKPTAEWKVPLEIEMHGIQSPWETIWLRLIAWSFLFFGLVYYFMIARRYGIPEIALTQHGLVLLMIASSQLALGFLYDRLSNRVELGLGLKKLQARIDQPSAVAAEIAVIQNGVVTGCDEGYLWLEEGTLFYKGLQTVFRLNADDIASLRSWPRRKRPDIDAGRPPRWLSVLGTKRKLTVKLSVIDPLEDSATRKRATLFDKALTLWLRDRPAGSLESRLPPLALHPSLARGAAVRNEGLVAGIVLNLINLALLATARFDFHTNDLLAAANAMEIGVALLLLWRSAALARGQWRDTKVRRELGLEALEFLPPPNGSTKIL